MPDNKQVIKNFSDKEIFDDTEFQYESQFKKQSPFSQEIDIDQDQTIDKRRKINPPLTVINSDQNTEKLIPSQIPTRFQSNIQSLEESPHPEEAKED